MLLKDLIESIVVGTAIHGQYNIGTKKNDDDCLLIEASCLADDQIIYENASYLSAKYFQKYYQKKGEVLAYGDFLIDTLSFNIILFDETIKALACENILILKTPNAYLRHILVDEMGKVYFRNQLKKALHNENFIQKIENIFIPESLAKIEEIKKENVRPDRQPINTLTINVRNGLMTLDKILKRIEHNEINLETGFQRKAGLWNVEVKSRFIEALIVKQPVPAFYFDATETTEEEDIWQVVDGLQRLSAMRDFILLKSFNLEGLYYLPQYEKKSFDELPRSAQRNIEESELITYIIEPPTSKEVKYKIFKSINTSALKLTAQEIRHALNQGSPAEWVEKLANKAAFKKTIPILSNDRIERMEDRELALRYLAFRMTHYKDIKPNSTDLLDEAMTQIYSIDEKQMERYSSDFGDALLLIDYIFTSTAYTKAMIGLENTGFVNPMFEIWTYAIATASEDEKKILEKRAKIIRETSKTLMQDVKFVQSFENPYTKNNIEIRFRTIENFIKQVTK